MQKLSLSVALLLTACGGAPDANDDVSDTAAHGSNTSGRATSGSETEPRCLEASDEAAPTLDGRWFVAEVDDEDVVLVLELQGGEGVALTARGTQEMTGQVRVEPASGDLQRLVVSDPSSDESFSLLWSSLGSGRALLLRPGRDELAIAWRSVPVPTALHGQWRVEAPDRAELIELTITADRIRYVEGSERLEGPVWGIGAGPERGIVVTFERGGRAQTTVLRLSPTGDDRYLSWEQGDEDYRVFYRPGDRPTWLAEGRAARAAAGPATDAP